MRPSKGNTSEKIQLIWHQIFQRISAPTTLAKVVDRYRVLKFYISQTMHLENIRKHYRVLYYTQHQCDRRVSLLLCGCKETLSYVSKGLRHREVARVCSGKETSLMTLSLVPLCCCRRESCCAAFSPSLPVKRLQRRKSGRVYVARALRQARSWRKYWQEYSKNRKDTEVRYRGRGKGSPWGHMYCSRTGLFAMSYRNWSRRPERKRQ